MVALLSEASFSVCRLPVSIRLSCKYFFIVESKLTIVFTGRSSEIFWIEKTSADAAEKRFLQKLENFIEYLNYTCFLGIRSYEIHYAVYPIGAFYKPHFDTFRKDSGRKLSFICYLNENWLPENGGQLVLHLAKELLEITPIGGRLVCFESDKILHEVKIANQKRQSITGWLKVD